MKNCTCATVTANHDVACPQYSPPSLPLDDRARILARFLRNQIALKDRPPVGCVQINNEEAEVCAKALEQVAAPPSSNLRSFQSRVWSWCIECFQRPDSLSREQRAFRFMEEAIELVQAVGTSREDVLRLVDYVYGRPPGSDAQEVGGVMVTLAALSQACVLDMEAWGEEELRRCVANTEKIRAKDLAKPQRSPLPGNAVETAGKHADLVRAIFARHDRCSKLLWGPAALPGMMLGPEDADAAHRDRGTLLSLLNAEQRGDAETTVALPPLDDTMRKILGRPNFTCGQLAQWLREKGHDIKSKAEDEQATVIYWLLGLYLQHGEKWVQAADEYLRPAVKSSTEPTA